ncbi:hypothetical protein L914_17985 [Phytophthora nicotianae]|uniref:Uncharacterized protein n=1 Tax=Phytophthora nicotianae TaxID=4792 RepID=W2MHA4_PHYNI|nr:hypothetical protein L914_17985 [Phytophthora nicotianae]
MKTCVSSAVSNGHGPAHDNDTLSAIAGTAMEEIASGRFLFWASRKLAEKQMSQTRNVSLCEAAEFNNVERSVDQAAKYEVSHFSGKRVLDRWKAEREPHIRRLSRAVS